MKLPSFEEAPNLGQFISSLYDLAIGFVGLAVFIQFIRAGIAYFFAAGNAGETHHAKEMMKNAVLGAILLLSAYLILNVINPDLVNMDVFDLNAIKEKIGPAPTNEVISSRSTGCQPQQQFLTLTRDGSPQIATVGSITLAGAQISWKAPGGNPEQGAGSTTFQTKYSQPGTYTITAIASSGGAPPVEATCTVIVKPYTAPPGDNPEATVAKDKFNQVGISVQEGVLLNGINNLTVTQLIGVKNGCDTNDTVNRRCSMTITRFQHLADGNDGLQINIFPTTAWLAWMGQCCTNTSGSTWKDSRTGTSYSKISDSKWAILIPAH